MKDSGERKEEESQTSDEGNDRGITHPLPEPPLSDPALRVAATGLSGQNGEPEETLPHSNEFVQNTTRSEEEGHDTREQSSGSDGKMEPVIGSMASRTSHLAESLHRETSSKPTFLGHIEPEIAGSLNSSLAFLNPPMPNNPPLPNNPLPSADSRLSSQRPTDSGEAPRNGVDDNSIMETAFQLYLGIMRQMRKDGNEKERRND